MPEITEQAFVDFLQVLPYVSYTDAEKEIFGMLDKALSADTLMFAYFTVLYDKYLYNPNSPMLNEELYLPVLKYIVNSERVGEIDKMRPAFRLEMALKNRVGNPATDFTYTLPSGKKGKLSGINADYTILFFNNPDCNACRAIKAEVEASGVVKNLLNVKVQGNRKKLVFLSVFPDPELEVWRRMLPEQPKEWMCTYDDGQVITKERLYDLRAIDRIELFKIHSFFKCPIRRLLAVENQPLFRIHPIAGHSRIGYKGCHSGCLHHCHGVTFCNSIPRYFLFATTGGK